jgi:hypothetical protein
MVGIEEGVPVANHAAAIAAAAGVRVLEIAPHPPHHDNRDGDHKVVSTGDEQDSNDFFDDLSSKEMPSDGDDGHNDNNDDEDRAYLCWGSSRGVGNHGRKIDDQNDHHDLLYDENLDMEDEAYVYRHMRGGIQEKVTILQQQKQQQQQGQNREHHDVSTGGDGGAVTTSQHEERPYPSTNPECPTPF